MFDNGLDIQQGHVAESMFEENGSDWASFNNGLDLQRDLVTDLLFFGSVLVVWRLKMGST